MKPYTERAAKYYDLLLESEVRKAPQEVKFFKSIWGARAKRVLDAACGTGRLSIPLADAGYDVVGIDITPAMLNVARAKAKGKTNPAFITANMLTYHPRRKFDAALCGSNTITHLMTRKKVLKCLKALRNNLNRNGVFIFDVWDVEKYAKPMFSFSKTVVRPNLKVRYTDDEKIDRKRHLHWWRHKATIIDHGKRLKLSFGGRLRYRTRQEWIDLLTQANFKNVRVLTRKEFGSKIYFAAIKS